MLNDYVGGGTGEGSLSETKRLNERQSYTTVHVAEKPNIEGEKEGGL